MTIAKMQIKRGTSADWTAANPVLAEGELGYDTTTDQLKVGDGATAWATLPVIAPSAGGGGGVTQSYAGTSTVGGSLETVVQRRHYLKQITLATPALLAAVETHLLGTSSVHSWGSGVWADAAGAPGALLAACFPAAGTSLYLPPPAGWFAQPIGKWLPAGTYWIGGQYRDSAASGPWSLAYAAGGTDQTITSTGDWMQSNNGNAVTTTRDYSIRANLIR